MTKTAKTLLKEGLMLDPAERALLADELLQSLDAQTKEIDEAWVIEAERRLELYLSGKIETYSVEEVLDGN